MLSDTHCRSEIICWHPVDFDQLLPTSMGNIYITRSQNELRDMSSRIEFDSLAWFNIFNVMKFVVSPASYNISILQISKINLYILFATEKRKNLFRVVPNILSGVLICRVINLLRTKSTISASQYIFWIYFRPVQSKYRDLRWLVMDL
mgnify:CR=1 FL=1